MINRKRLLAEFLELTRIDSPTKNERQIADILKDRLINLNMTVTEDQAGLVIGGNCGNVYAYLKGNLTQAPVVLLSAHMDTVDPCLGIEPILQNGLITSTGSTILGQPAGEAMRIIIIATVYPALFWEPVCRNHIPQRNVSKKRICTAQQSLWWRS